MTYVSHPTVMVDHPTVLIAFEATPTVGGGRRFHVDIRPTRYETPLLTFAGTLDDLHALFLGLHNVLVDAGTNEAGRAETVVEPSDDGPGADRVGLVGGELGDVEDGLLGDLGSGAEGDELAGPDPAEGP